MIAVPRSRPAGGGKERPRRRHPGDTPATRRDPAGARLVGGEADVRQLSEQPVYVEALAERWRSTFDAAELALRAARFDLAPQELREHHGRLAAERGVTAHLLEALARDTGRSARFGYLTVPRWAARRLLGLPSGVTACVFNLDGVLIGSAAVHAAAWAETFDRFIWARSDRTRGRFAPFDLRSDYQLYIHGKPRLEGVRAFLASRGISLPEGDPADAPAIETVHGLANRKNDALVRRLEQEGVAAFEGSRRYLEIARDAGLRLAVVSASAHAQTILERAGLAGLIDESVDGNAIVTERLRGRPAPDTLLAACRRLGAEPRSAAVFETSNAGVAAARDGGFEYVVAVDRNGQGEALRVAGADLVVAGLDELLDRASPSTVGLLRHVR